MKEAEEVYDQKVNPGKPPKHVAERNAVLSVAPTCAYGSEPECPRLSIVTGGPTNPRENPATIIVLE